LQGVRNIHPRAYARGVLWYGVNPVPWTHVRGYWGLPYKDFRTLIAVLTPKVFYVTG